MVYDSIIVGFGIAGISITAHLEKMGKKIIKNFIAKLKKN